MGKSKKNISVITLIFALLVGILVCVGSAKDSVKNVETSQVNSNVKLYSDVNENDWFYSDVKFMSDKGFMTGTDSNVFSPYEKTTRGMIVTILWRLDGQVHEEGKAFSDVSSDSYYHDAVIWASNNQIVNGYNEMIFGADDAATREQMCSIIYRYAAYKQYDTTQKLSLEKYADRTQISDYAVEAMEWGYANEIISGTSDITLSPQDYVQRCQVAAILQRFCSKYVNSKAENDTAGNMNNTPETADNAFNSTVKNSYNSGGSSGGGSSYGGTSGGGQTSIEVNTAAPTMPSDQPDTKEDNKVNNNPAIVVNNVDAKKGENVQVSAIINNNPGILGMTLIAYYDETYCTLESVDIGDAFAGILDLTTSKTLNSGVKFVWDGIDIADDQIKDGTVVLMNFHVADNAPEGKIPITLKCYDGDAVDKNLVNVPLQIESGSITVK